MTNKIQNSNQLKQSSQSQTIHKLIEKNNSTNYKLMQDLDQRHKENKSTSHCKFSTYKTLNKQIPKSRITTHKNINSPESIKLSTPLAGINGSTDTTPKNNNALLLLKQLFKPLSSSSVEPCDKDDDDIVTTVLGLLILNVGCPVRE